MSNQKQRIAVCIPTIRRSAEVEDFLANCADYYIDAGCDIYYFDSNEDDETKKAIKNYGHDDHIFYIRTVSNLGLDAAVLLIFEYIKEYEYDYIWLCTDSIQYSKEALQTILQHTNNQYDMIVIDVTSKRNVYFKEIENPVEYFSCTAYVSTLFGAVLINAKTMIRDANWEYYREKFSDPKVKAFAYIHFYYHRLLQLSSFHGAILSLGKNQHMNSRVKKKSIYVRDFIYTWCGQWADVINDLPVEYGPYKSSIIRQGGSQCFSDTDQFLRMRLDNLYSLRDYLKYREKWAYVTPVPKQKLFGISLMPKVFAKLYFQRSLERGTKNLKQFCSKHIKIVILGAGSIGNAYGTYFDKRGIEFDAFCVLHWKNEPQELLNHPVYHLDDILNDDDEDVGFIIGMGRDDAIVALEAVKDKIPASDIFFDSAFRRDLMFSLGYRKFFAW